MAESQNNAVIQVKNLNSYYGSKHILKDINLEIFKKEIFVIMGPSGSGKSTLLSNLLGLKTYESGKITILGKTLHELTSDALLQLRQQMGVAFQGGALFSSLSLIENIELPLREHSDLDKTTIRIMARMKLQMMKLLEAEDLMPSELSGGMLKRAGLARAVAMDPRLLFFDEPSSGLDPATSAELDHLILQLRDAMNMSIVVITHDMDSAMNIADRIAVLYQGEVIFIGNKQDIMNTDDERVRNILERKIEHRKLDSDEYLKQLTQ